QVKGVKINSLSLAPPKNVYVKGTLPGGQNYFWPGYRPLVSGEPDTDLSTLLEGYITITPLRLDTTEDELIPLLQDWTFP
ncbi:MAG: 5'/3'-nucleotidase SurE, partial [Acidobacteria bacterium]|nr:5'/3'-nucleotidase SurE [Acidobacteriota bacterium]